MLQAKPNRCLIETEGVPDVIQALECGWFDAVTSGSLDTQLNLFGRDVMAVVARYRLQHGQQAEADTIVLRGLTAGREIGCCTGLYFIHLFVIHFCSLMETTSREQPGLLGKLKIHSHYDWHACSLSGSNWLWECTQGHFRANEKVC